MKGSSGRNGEFGPAASVLSSASLFTRTGRSPLRNDQQSRNLFSEFGPLLFWPPLVYDFGLLKSVFEDRVFCIPCGPGDRRELNCLGGELAVWD